MQPRIRYAVPTNVIVLCPNLMKRTLSSPPPPSAQRLDNEIASRTTEIEGVQLHYFTAGHGPSLILLHGYVETSLIWKPVMPLLAQRFTVIAPDLPGIGDLAIPANGLDMKTAAIRMHPLVKSLGVEKAYARSRFVAWWRCSRSYCMGFRRGSSSPRSYAQLPELKRDQPE